MTKNKSKKMGIRTRLFLWIMGIVALVLVLLWVLLIFNLDNIYRAVKSSESRSMMSKAVSIVENGSGDYSEITSLSEEYDITAYVLDSTSKILYSSSERFDVFSTMFEARNYYINAERNGGEVFLYVDGDVRNEIMPPIRPDEFPGPPEGFVNPPEDFDPEFAPPEFEISPKTQGGENFGEFIPDFGIKPGNYSTESQIYAKIVRSGDSNYFIMLTTLLTPVNATVRAIRTILIIVSAIVVAVAAAAALLLARSLSKPLEDMSKSALRLAKADYDVEFPESGIREMDDLSDTLNYATEELEKTEYLRRELVANVGHDLRTPLTMIKGYAEVMQDIPGEATPENLQIIIDETDRLSGLVSDLLDTSQLEAKVTEMHPERYDLTESIRCVMARYNKLIESEGYRIEFSDDGPAYVEADEERIYQVLYNLVGNAVNYTDDSSKLVQVYETIRNGNVRVEVRDHGEGIKQKDLPYVWDRYYRSSEAHKRAKIGTGLGLSIVKGVLEMHHAQYGVESTEGEGSLFWFELPLSSDQPHTEEVPDAAAEDTEEKALREAAEKQGNEEALRNAETMEVGNHTGHTGS